MPAAFEPNQMNVTQTTPLKLHAPAFCYTHCVCCDTMCMHSTAQHTEINCVLHQLTCACMQPVIVRPVLYTARTTTTSLCRFCPISNGCCFFPNFFFLRQHPLHLHFSWRERGEWIPSQPAQDKTLSSMSGKFSFARAWSSFLFVLSFSLF